MDNKCLLFKKRVMLPSLVKTNIILTLSIAPRPVELPLHRLHCLILVMVPHPNKPTDE